MHQWNTAEFRLTEFVPEEDDCKFLLLKVVEQAVRDYLSLGASIAPIEKFHYNTAEDFIFDDTYRIKYGESEFSLEDVLSVLDIELAWFRDRVEKLKILKVKEISLRLQSKRKEG